MHAKIMRRLFVVTFYFLPCSLNLQGYPNSVACVWFSCMLLCIKLSLPSRSDSCVSAATKVINSLNLENQLVLNRYMYVCVSRLVHPLNSPNLRESILLSHLGTCLEWPPANKPVMAHSVPLCDHIGLGFRTTIYHALTESPEQVDSWMVARNKKVRTWKAYKDGWGLYDHMITIMVAIKSYI
jgi:hypothetical protein